MDAAALQASSPSSPSSPSKLRDKLRTTVCCCFGSGGAERTRWRRRGAAAGEFRYDALSYALNFDEGHGASPEGDYTGYRDFSARFVAPPASAKSSMDLTGSTLGMGRRPLPSPGEIKRKPPLPPGGGRLATIYRGAPPPE